MSFLLGCFCIALLVLVYLYQGEAILSRIRHKLFSLFWHSNGAKVDGQLTEIKRDLYRDVSGNVLEFGSGIGNTLKYLDLDKVSNYLAVEPNVYFHKDIEAEAIKCGFSVKHISDDDIRLSLLSEKVKKTSDKPCLYIYGRGLDKSPETEALANAFRQFDSIISSFVLCSVESVDNTLSIIANFLSSSGKFYYIEHVHGNKHGSHGSHGQNKFHYIQQIAALLFRAFQGHYHQNKDTSELLKDTNLFKNVVATRTLVANHGHGGHIPVVYGYAERL